MTLLSKLKACVPDERDIPLLLASVAGGGQRATKSGATEYLTAEPEPVVFARLRFKNGLIESLQPGPGMKTQSSQDDFLARARVEGARTHGTFVSSRVLFSQIPLKGSFSWNHQFRITPCLRRVRIGRGLSWLDQHRLPLKSDTHLGPPFPFVLEVRSFRSPNPLLEANRSLRDLDTYQYLLTLLLHGRIGYVHHNSKRQWTAVKHRNRIEYHLLSPGLDSGLSGRTDGFARRRLPPAPTYDGLDYYNHLWGRDAQLHMPDQVAADLITYHALPSDLIRRFNRACYWYSLGVQFHSEPSLATVAFFTAVESLVPRPSSSHCPSCGKPAGPGPTKLFTEHLRKYGVVPPSLHSRREAIYGVRSALVHGSHAERTDEDFFGRASPFVDPLLVELVAQRSLLGWLRDVRRAI